MGDWDSWGIGKSFMKRNAGKVLGAKVLAKAGEVGVVTEVTG